MPSTLIQISITSCVLTKVVKFYTGEVLHLNKQIEGVFWVYFVAIQLFYHVIVLLTGACIISAFTKQAPIYRNFNPCLTCNLAYKDSILTLSRVVINSIVALHIITQ